MRTLIKVVVSVVLLLVIGLAVLLFTDFSSPRLAQALVDLAARKGGVELGVDEARLNLRTGLLLEGVTARSEAEGEQLEVELDRLVLEHRFWPLLKGEVLVERLILERPRVRMVSAPPGEASGSRGVERPGTGEPETGKPETGEPEPTSRLRLEVAEVVIEQGYLSSTTADGQGATVVEGLDLVLRDLVVDPDEPALLLAVSGQGWLEAESLSLDERRLNAVAAAFEADGGRLRLAEFETSTEAGDLRVEEIVVDLAQNPYRYRLLMEADAIDLGLVLGLPPGLGSASLELRATGEGPGLAGAVAEMSLHGDGGTLPSVALLRDIDRILGTEIDAAAYEPVVVRLSLAEDVLVVDPTEIVTEIARIEIGGTIELGGSIDLKVGVGIERDLFTSPAISDDVLDTLTRSGRLIIPLRVTGTLDAPRFGPDMDLIKERTRWLAEEVRDSLRARFQSQVRSMIRQRLGRRG